MHENTEITLRREVSAIQIPSGDTVTLPEGATVVITQSLGGTYTVASNTGLARIQAADADALGLTAEGEMLPIPATDADLAPEVMEGRVWDKLKTCFDPEIPVNIVDLGLVYDCQVVPEDTHRRVQIQMTLTAPGCGMGPSIAADAERKIMSVPGVTEANVALVWDPPWNQHMISEAGKMKLGIL